MHIVLVEVLRKGYELLLFRGPRQVPPSAH
jgi:hypothetical protein